MNKLKCGHTKEQHKKMEQAVKQAGVIFGDDGKEPTGMTMCQLIDMAEGGVSELYKKLFS